METRADPQGSPLEIGLFGPFAVRVDGRPLPPLRSRKEQWLLALLALRHGREVERDWLAGVLWPDSEESRGLFYLRRALSDLRHALSTQAYRLRSPNAHSVGLDLAGATADLVAFDTAVARGDTLSLEEAVSYHRGPLLEGCTEEWVLLEREQREQAYRKALETLAAQAMQQNDPQTAVRHLRLAVESDPFAESVHGALMEALAASGNYASATLLYRELRLRLHRELNTEPAAETRALFERLRERAGRQPPSDRRRPVAPVLPSLAQPAPETLPSDFPSRRSLLARPNNLSVALTSFIGREKEMQHIKQVLGVRREALAETQSHSSRLTPHARLLTLTGAGGCGKTRLALQVATEVLEEYPDGVFVVELAALSDASLLPQAVAIALRVREEAGRPLLEALLDCLKRKTLLLVLDNCEHLVEACAQTAAALLRVCPHLQILATSREALNIQGETVWRVPSMSLPDPKAALVVPGAVASTGSPLPPPPSLLHSEAVRLFVERALLSRPSFALTSENARAVASICRRLDGIPLAIELATARVKMLTPEQIAARLDDRFRLLRSERRDVQPRQQTLQATMDWSYDLLGEEEQVLLCRLSVFGGGWTLEAAEAVCVDERIEEWEVLELLSRLVDKSLVVLEEGEPGARRYGLLETVRQYAQERLGELGEFETLRVRHRDCFLSLAEEAVKHMRGPEQAEWLERLEAEHDNLRAVLGYCLKEEGDTDPSFGLRLSGALQMFWGIRGYLSEGREWLVAALSQAGAQERTEARARALNGAGVLAGMQGDNLAARAFYEESLSIQREIDDRQGISIALNHLGSVARDQGDYVAARAYYEESLSVSRESGYRLGISHVLNSLGLLAQDQADYAASRAYHEESLAIKRQIGDLAGIARSLNNLGSLAASQGDYVAARAHYEESLPIYKKIGDRQGTAISLYNLGSLSYNQGDYAASRAYQAESLAIKQEMGDREGIARSLEVFAALITAESASAIDNQEPNLRHAAHLWGAAQRLSEEIGVFPPPYEREEREREVAEAREALGEVAFAAAWEEGRALTLEQAIAYALRNGEAIEPRGD